MQSGLESIQFFWLCARICKIVHSTRLSERHYVRSVGRPNSTFSTEWPIKRDLAVEMTLQGRDDGVSATTVLLALGAWKPAKDAGFHIPTATATAAVKLGQTAKPAPIAHFYRFSCRTVFLWTSGRGVFRGPTALICRAVSLYAFSRTRASVLGARVGSQGASVLPLRCQWRSPLLYRCAHTEPARLGGIGVDQQSKRVMAWFRQSCACCWNLVHSSA